MGVLCFGSYATLIKNAIGKISNEVLVPLLCRSIVPTIIDIDKGDCNNWINCNKNPHDYITSVADNEKVKSQIEDYFATNIIPKIKSSNSQEFLEKLHSLIQNDKGILTADKKSFMKIASLGNVALFLSTTFIYAVQQTNIIQGDSLSDVVALPLPKSINFSLSSINRDFKQIFTEVSHEESLGLLNPNCIRTFHLDIASNEFLFSDLHKFLQRNIGRYVFSRAKLEQFKLDGDEELIGAKAISLIENLGFNDAQISEELGDIILYIFLENVLGAPKLYNKIELTANGQCINQGGVHLLSLSNASSSYQIVFGKSNIVNDLKSAIDNAFMAIVSVKSNTSKELQILESSILTQSFDNTTSEYLRDIIIPSKRKTKIVVDNAFGVFLGYSLGLDSSKYSSPDFRIAVEQKMVEDIKSYIPYITSKIKEANLETCSFYFYLIPFNNADGEKQNIMKLLLDGGSV